MSVRVVQGWHPDPFGLHEARYFSAAGEPTKLVRDGGVEGYDEPPSGADQVAAAMARISAEPESPSDYPPRDASAHGPASRGGRRPFGKVGFAASGIILAVAAVAAFFVVQAPEHSAPPGATDEAFVTQAVSRTLQQHTADVVLSASAAVGGTDTAVHGSGAFDLGGKAGTVNLTIDSRGGASSLRVLWVNGNVYLAEIINGQGLVPKGKAWIAVPLSGQQSGTSDLVTNPTAALASLEKHGLTVSALGTKVIGGVSSTGYTVTSPGEHGAVTVWINPQHLVSEISLNTTIGLSSSGASATLAPAGTADQGTVDLTVDISYSAAPLHVTAPPAASTISSADILQHFEQDPAVEQISPS